MQVFAASIGNNSNNNVTRNNPALAAVIFAPPIPIQVPTISSVRPASAPIAPMPLPAHLFLQSAQSPKQKVKRRQNPTKLRHHTLSEIKN
ncbi:hypothetical protein [Parasitella parasitica]|uniref:Uncharacterized protein n=1 Tax=Parasitella parasitica TaxID=35722 RepID=A0A0B7MVU6_9FUNG|nr:hypothetical protein [Parasitella parasitica]